MSQASEKYSALLELAKSGCQGNAHDYQVWLKADFKIESSEQDVLLELEALVADDKLKNHTRIKTEFLIQTHPEFTGEVTYSIPSSLDSSPLQWVRSRLESFLIFHKVEQDTIIDLSIATTEAMENAVKYSTDKELLITYHIKAGLFYIRIENEVKDITPEADIKSGKYSGTLTLMRGMMVMMNLLDEVDIDLMDDKNTAVFSASHKLDRTK